MVGVDGRLVYESLVLPDNQVADYNTRFSGITKRDLGEKWNSYIMNDWFLREDQCCGLTHTWHSCTFEKMTAILSVLAFSVVYVVWFFLQSCLFKIVGNNLNFGLEIQVKIFRKAILMYFFSSLRTLLCRGPDVLSSHTLGVVCSFGATDLQTENVHHVCSSLARSAIFIGGS